MLKQTPKAPKTMNESLSGKSGSWLMNGTLVRWKNDKIPLSQKEGPMMLIRIF